LPVANARWEEIIRSTLASLPPGHYYVAIFENNYGDCLTAMKRYEDAERTLKASLAPLEKTLGADHPRVKKARARWWRYMKRGEERMRPRSITNREPAAISAARFEWPRLLIAPRDRSPG